MAELGVRINEFTDPGCPWAYSAEPFRRRLNWLYEGSIEWIPRMVVLADAASDYERRGYTPAWVAESSKQISRSSPKDLLGRITLSRGLSLILGCSAGSATRTPTRYFIARNCPR